MALIQKFIYTWPEGATRIEMHDWLKTLPQSEQYVYWEGRRNGDNLRQIAIDEGRLIVKEGAYEWKDTESFNIGKENDLTWYEYWMRWQAETGVVFSIDLIEE